MAYRDWLVGLSPLAADYIAELCRKRYTAQESQILTLYQLAQQVGTGEFLAALELAHDQQSVGAEYVQTILEQPQPRPVTRQRGPAGELPAALALPQRAVERELAHYEQYVANRSVLWGGEQ